MFDTLSCSESLLGVFEDVLVGRSLCRHSSCFDSIHFVASYENDASGVACRKTWDDMVLNKNGINLHEDVSSDILGLFVDRINFSSTGFGIGLFAGLEVGLREGGCKKEHRRLLGRFRPKLTFYGFWLEYCVEN